MRPAAAALIVLLAAASARAWEQEQARGAWPAFEAWIAAVDTHTPGATDAALREMLRMPTPELESIFPHIAVTLASALAEEDRRAGFDEFLGKYARRGQTPEAARSKAAIDRVRRIGIDRFLKRAALMHAEMAVVAPSAHLSTGAGTGFLAADGRQFAEDGRPWHWIIGRGLLHLVRGARADPHVRLWYQAAGHHMLASRNFTEARPHLDRALELFAGDAEIEFLAGLLHEAQSAPAIQAAVADQIERLPPRQRRQYQPAVGSMRGEVSEAIDAFSKSIAADPAHLESRIRLGRLLASIGKPEPAAAHLREALTRASDPRHRYLAQLFLGRAEEMRGDMTGARAAYTAASQQFPGAQSPRFALSQLERHTGNRIAAAEALRFLENPSSDDDPWWSYHYVTRPGHEAWFAKLRAVYRGEVMP